MCGKAITCEKQKQDMRYPVNKFCPAWYRRRQWPVGRWSAWRRPLLLVLSGLLVGAIIATGEAYLVELNKRLSSEVERQSQLLEARHAAAQQDVERERAAYVNYWKNENPELAKILSTKWNSKKVAQK